MVECEVLEVIWSIRVFLRSHVLVILGSAGMDVNNLLQSHWLL